MTAEPTLRVIVVEIHSQVNACYGLRKEDDRRGECAAQSHGEIGCLRVLIRLGYAGFGVEAARQRQSGELVAYRLDSGETYSAACLEGEGDLAHAVVEGTVPSVVVKSIVGWCVSAVAPVA